MSEKTNSSEGQDNQALTLDGAIAVLDLSNFDSSRGLRSPLCRSDVEREEGYVERSPQHPLADYRRIDVESPESD